MDVTENGPLGRLARGLGSIVETSTTGDAGEVEARAFHVARKSGADVVLAASIGSNLVIALLVEKEGAASAMAAARVLVNERADVLRAGRIVSLPAGAPGTRSVRGSTGSFAVVAAAAAGLPSSVDLLIVHAHPPLSEWEKATLDEVKSAVPDLVSRFRPPKPRAGSAAAAKPKPPPAQARTVVRRRPSSEG